MLLMFWTKSKSKVLSQNRASQGHVASHGRTPGQDVPVSPSADPASAPTPARSCGNAQCGDSQTKIGQVRTAKHREAPVEERHSTAVPNQGFAEAAQATWRTESQDRVCHNDRKVTANPRDNKQVWRLPPCLRQGIACTTLRRCLKIAVMWV